MKEILDSQFFDWFLYKALFGLAIGYILRVIEHYAWRKHDGDKKEMFYWSIIVLMQSICVGGPLAYVIVAILANNIPGKDFLVGSAYITPIFTSFIAMDLRQLIRRIQGKPI
jgi:hypothetical protein